MSRLILILLALASSQAFAASYERQSEAIKVCQQADPDDHPSVFYTCMWNAGWEFCGKCEQFGTMMGGTCANVADAMERPACWYRMGEQPQNVAATLRAQWKRWIENRGWEKQSAPYGPSDVDWDNKIVVKPPYAPREIDKKKGRRWYQGSDGGYYKCPTTIDEPAPDQCFCEDGDWPRHCTKRRNEEISRFCNTNPNERCHDE